MMKQPWIIMGLILYFSILIIGAPFTIDINAYGNHPIFSLGNVSHLVYAQGDSDKNDSGSDSDKNDSGSDSDKSDFDSNLGTQEDSDNSTPKSLTNPDGDTNVEPPIEE